MNVRALSQRAVRRATLLLAAGAAAACNEDFITGPNDRSVTLELRGWADTVVLGDARTVRVRVLDSRGREITGVRTQLDVGAPSVLESRLNAAGASAASLAVTSAADSVALAAARPGPATVVLTLLDPRFSTTEVPPSAVRTVSCAVAARTPATTTVAVFWTAVVV